ncbi:MAG TPA: hypothetical protein DEB06_06055 [Phycisphaerales bacterium]|nr:hypothetical protein [Phycisphaerales bacterium]
MLGVLLTAAAHAGTPWELVWADEFDGTTLDASRWTAQTGTGTLFGLPAGWGNNELQYYTNRSQNLSVSDGALHIVARAEAFAGSNYTSARIRTAGKFEVLYGRIEARITIPSGTGIWPAFWMLPTASPYGSWAASGEIDIMESTNAADRIYATIHHGAPWPNNASNGNSYAPGVDFGASPFVYAVEWEPDTLRWYVNDQLIHTVTSATWFSTAAPSNPRAPFDVQFHLLLNVAVGGNFPGPPNGAVGFPMEMTVDYVRVYQRQQLPFDSAPSPIPGRIEAEDYDQGGPGVAYLDTDSSNNGAQYRPTEAVDIEASSEGGFNIGWIRQGEWTEYSAQVAAAGHYRADCRVASQTNGGSFRLEFNAVNRTGTLLAPVTGGWQQWTTVSAPLVLPAGPTTVRFVNESGPTGEFNLNWIDLALLARAGDVNADQSIDIDDLYDFERATGQFPDVDLDGIPGTAADEAALRATLRQPELQAPRAAP